RSSLLSRRDPDEEVDQPVAANIDDVLIVCGLDRPVRAGRIQRSVAQAWDAGAVPLVVLTKADLDPSGDVRGEAVSIVEEADPTVDVMTVSAAGGDGIADLRARVADRTIVLFGESGAGKSTLLNALAGEDLADTGAVREGDSKGRHTTTARTLHRLPSGGCVIDTPGVRAVGLSADTDAVEATFEDIGDLASSCRFRDCRHESEPGCAVKAAVEAGTLAADRLEAFLRLRNEAEGTALRNDVVARRREERRFGRITREAQRHKRPRR
ncbi:MAG: ribosome small subunit-dependent GTPase A, partial [Actinomycetota bacterium]